MKVRVKVEVEKEVRFLKIDIPVRYGEEDIPNDFPLRVRRENLDKSMIEKWTCYGDYDRWQAVIDLESGVIRNWPDGKTGSFEMKVCDEGFYYLLDGEGAVIASIEGDYVPNRAVPPKDGYGDYVALKIEDGGKVTNLYDRPDFSQFFESEG
ncbi:MAG: hypothetical protein LBP98_09240 [Tannerella sp.]|jgi:hypothetical protein|nr:hypothetical protein [Tannerella sp.]